MEALAAPDRSVKCMMKNNAMIDEIEKCHQYLNDSDLIDLKYYRRNMVAYEYVSYINHIVACYYSKNYEVMTTFFCRAKKFIAKNGEKYIDEKYTEMTKKYLDLVQSFIIDLNDNEMARRIKECSGI